MHQVNTTATYILLHFQTQLALEAPKLNTYSYDSLQLGPPSQNNPNQMWILEDKGKDRYQIILGYPDQVLTGDGNRVTLRKGTGDRYKQFWKIDNSNPQKLKIYQYKNEKNYLGIDDHKVIIKQNPSYDMIDFWELKEVKNNADLNRSSYICCMRTNKLLDVPASKGHEGVQICVWQPNYRFNQRWKIYRAGEVFIIKSLKTELNLDIEGEDYSDGASIIQWHSTGQHNQFWNFEKKGENAYRISSWYDPTLQIGHSRDKLIINKGEKYIWRVQGFFPHIDD